MSRFLLIILILFSINGCSNTEDSNTNGFKLDNIPSDTIKGKYSSGFESSTFIPCNSDELWWTLAGTSQLFSIYGSIASDSEPSVFIQAKGDVSEVGPFGHLGFYDREFNITQLFEMKKWQEGGCDNIAYDFKLYSSTVVYDGLIVYLNSYIYILRENGPDPVDGFRAVIKMQSLEGVIPNTNITDVELSVLRDDNILWTAAPNSPITELQNENAILVMFSGGPSSILFEDVDIIFKFTYEGNELAIMQKRIPVNWSSEYTP